jgi:hypothetical protein
MQGVKAWIARLADRSLVAEDRSAADVRDRTGPEPEPARACSRDRPAREEQYGTVTRGAEATTQVERPVRHQMDTSEWRSNDS